MGKKGKKYTPISIKALVRKEKRYEEVDTSGVRIVIQPSGVMSYVTRYRRPGDGKPAKITHGRVGVMTLAEARKAHADAMAEIAKGHDPGGDRIRLTQVDPNKVQTGDTFEAVATRYLELAGKKLRTAATREATLKRLVLPVIGARPIDALKRSEIVKMLDHVEAVSGTRQADLCLAYISKICNWHAARSDDFKSPIVRGMARETVAERARERTLTDLELAAIWRAAKADEHPYGALIRLLLLTAARRSEIADMEWKEIDGCDWTLPSARNKVKCDLLRPLSTAALSVLKELPQVVGIPYVLSCNRRPINDFHRLKAKLDADSGVSNWVLHDLRRTARSLMSRAGVSADIAERCLGHLMPGVRGTYDRYSYYAEKKDAYDKLAELIMRIVTPVAEGVAA